MALFSAFIGVLAAVCLFLFSIQKFSRQVERVAGDRFKSVVAAMTSTPLKGTLIGAIVTSVIQSSTATTVMVVGLVNAGVLSFSNSLGVIFGANIGTTITTQLIALNITAIAPILVLVGFVMFMFDTRWKRWGKPVFYFGLVFFSFAVINTFIEPLSKDPWVISLFTQTVNLPIAILLGALFTAMFQSSTVTTGLAIVLVGNGIISFEQAVGIVLGANIGTTSTAYLASLVMNTAARRAAIAHVLFNVLGVIIFIPLLLPVMSFIDSLQIPAAQQVALMHILFNLVPAAVFLIFLQPFGTLVTSLVKNKN